MEKTKSHVNAILDLTLEIVYLLTGENYSLVKAASLERDIYPPMRKKWSRTQNPLPPPPFVTAKRKNDQKILEVIQKITELLTGEVPIRCQDVSVYFSMEEWEYLEGHKDLYKDIVMMEDQPPLTSPDGSSNRNTPERGPNPLYSLDSPQEDHKNMEEDHFVVVKVESDEEDLYLRCDKQITEKEELPLEISTECEQRTSQSSEEHLTSEYEDFVDSSPGEDTFGSNLHSGCHSVARSPDDSNTEESYLDGLYNLSPDIHRGHSRVSRSPNTSGYGLVLVDTADTSTHGVVEPFFCSACVKWFLLKLPPGQHKATTSKVPFLCPDCGRCLVQHEGLPQPRRTDIVKLTHVCFECGKCFIVESNLFRHRLTHSKDQPYQCADGRAQINRSAERHRAHSGEGLLECSECGERLSGKTCLLNHKKLHAEEKPYSYAEDCKRFADQEVLYRSHERAFQEYKPFSCPECGKFYTSKSVLNRHLKLHSDYKPFPCSVCGKCFANKSLLNSHRRVHSKPFSCAECGKCFTFKYHLTKHEQTHAGGSLQRNFLYANGSLDNGTEEQGFNF